MLKNMKKYEKNKKKIILFKKIVFILIDAFIISVSSIISLILIEKFDEYKHILLYFIPCEIIVIIVLFSILKLYNVLWRYAGVSQLLNIAFVYLIVTLTNFIIAIFSGFNILPYGFPIVNFLILLCATGFIRYLNKIFVYFESNNLQRKKANFKKVMIIGGGVAGAKIIKEMLESKQVKKKPVCIVDDEVNKIGTYIYGIPVVGNCDSITNMVETYNVDEIIFSIPSCTPKERAKILNMCKETSCKVQVLPGIYELVNGTISVSKIRDVDIIDLLGREQIKVNLNEILDYIEEQVILVTGGGGSIGSELCRQIATHKPKKLIILDIYENNAYEIEQELKRKLPSLNLVTLIASIRNTKRIDDIFKKYRPDIVFNAAAHKHVPLMETSPNEAIKNNVFGTLNVARAADKFGTKRFVQISTDKAVNPTNIMGASKRICEMIIQAIGKKSQTCEFVAVRFGNVLGSNGSVIPLFKKQISEGGPVTVTHKDIIRYFMTIPEAVSLVLQAGAYAKGGEIFVLDMGEPVRIYDLAENLIKLSGYTPNVDMEIKITGLRPGEKLYEERLMKEEGLKQTSNGLISIAKPIEFDENALFLSLEELYKEAYNETDKMKELVKNLVPTYKIDGLK